MASGFLTLISFFTRIPVGRKITYDENNFKRALSLYTLMGAVIGILLVAVYFLFGRTYIAFLRGLVLTIGYVAITGGIHLDGAADTSDGLFSGRTGERVFEIMSDSHIGAFGVICLIVILLSQFVLFSFADMFTCFLMPVVGRACLAVSCLGKKYAKKTKGMGTTFIESMDTKTVAVNLIFLAIFVVITPYRMIFSVSCFATIAATLFTAGWIEEKIGGMTGDTCGFIIETSQIIFMILVLFLKG